MRPRSASDMPNCSGDVLNSKHLVIDRGMSRTLRFLGVLIVGLLGLTLLGYLILVGTTRRWFEQDLSLRANLAVASARGALVRNWAPDRLDILRETLADVTRDE